MPRAVGRVERIVRGNFVSPALSKTSWLALTSQHASICYFSGKTDTVICTAVGAETPRDVDIDFRENGASMPTMTFAVQPGATMPTKEIYRSIRTFMAALNTATGNIREHSARGGARPGGMTPM